MEPNRLLNLKVNEPAAVTCHISLSGRAEWMRFGIEVFAKAFKGLEAATVLLCTYIITPHFTSLYPILTNNEFHTSMVTLNDKPCFGTFEAAAVQSVQLQSSPSSPAPSPRQVQLAASAFLGQVRPHFTTTPGSPH